MVNKCAVFDCKRGYESEEPQHEDYHAFYFPLDERKSHLLPAWEKFVCWDSWKPSANSVICEFHFEDRLIRKGKRWTLKWKLNPMPTKLTDEMKAMPQSVQSTPAAPPRKPPAKRTYQEDEINAFLSQDIIGDFSELNSTHAPPGFQCTKSDNSIVFFNLTYVDGFPVIFESIKVDQSLHVQLQFNGHPVPLPAWFTKGRNATLTRFSQLNNFPNNSVPHVIQAIPEVTITGEWRAEKISASLHSLAQTGFTVRGIVTDNHNSNVNAFKCLKQKFGKGDQLFIQHPSNPHKNIYLFFDTPHLIKNVRNNLLNSRRFVFPQFDYEKDGIEILCPAGYLAWSDLHQMFEHDVKLQSYLKKAHKLSYQVLHPGNKKQSVPLALAIFHETTTAAFESYFPEREDASKFLKMINTWWLICNSKEMSHPNPLGNAVRVGDGKTDFLEALADWLEK